MASKKKKLIPPDPENMNNNRAYWAGEAIDVFEGRTGVEQKDSLCDLLADLRHWSDRQGFNWERELKRAMSHYKKEITE